MPNVSIEAAAAENASLAESQPGLRSLEKRLLAVGGSFVILRQEEFLAALLRRGRTWSKPNVQKIDGRAHQCHANVAQLYLKEHSGQEPSSFQMVVGYGLDGSQAGGTWLQHTWGLLDGALVETTVVFDAYFGAVLSGREALKSAVAQLTDKEKTAFFQSWAERQQEAVRP